MVRTHILYPDGRVQVDDGIALARCAPEGCTVWVDVVASSELGLAAIPPEWRFHPLALEDCIHPQRRAKYERFPAHSFIVLQALDTGTADEIDTVSVRVFVRPGLVVSVHDRPVSAIDRVDKLVLSDSDRVGFGAERVLHALVDAVIDEFVVVLDRWEDRIDQLADLALADEDRQVVPQLVSMRNHLGLLRRSLLPQREIITRLRDGLDEKDPGRHYFQDVLDHIDAVIDTAALLAEVCSGALQVRSDHINENLNRVMKYLAIVSTLLLPMTVVSGVFGMNFDVIPTTHDPLGFWGAILLMVASAAALVVWFRVKRWL